MKTASGEYTICESQYFPSVMSELQISLLGIGVVVVLLIYIYSWWQQRGYQQKYQETFKREHADILYDVPEKDARHNFSQGTYPESAQTQDMQPTATRFQTVTPAVFLTSTVLDEQKSASAVLMESGCALLGDTTDYIIEIKLDRPNGVEMLTSLWTRRFDFEHDIMICGLNGESNTWEKVMAESTLHYAAFKLALQLVKRSGAVSEPKLARFRDMVSSLSTKPADRIIVPEVGIAAARALKLDEFCITVDCVIGLNLLPDNQHPIPGSEVAEVCERHGFVLQTDGAFHLLDKRGHILCSLASMDSILFQYHTLGQHEVSGVTLLLDVPLTEQPVQRFDQMVEVAREMAKQFKASIVDDHRKMLAEDSFVLIREQITAIETKMTHENIVPGSAQARRLFS
ncbi:MAG: cell division protein ZipA C-terminal FtsZ-binding domain-containing protein [Candidatus Nitrotoga sp.]